MSASDPVLALVFVAGAAVSLMTSWLLVSRLERVGARLGLSEAMLGLVAALAADAPELTAAVTALSGHHSRIGAGVVIGSNVFNLAALLGVGALVAGSIALHRRVIILEGVVAVAIATVCLLVVLGSIPALAGLCLTGVVLAVYVLILGARRALLRRLGFPGAWLAWLAGAVREEEQELVEAIHPRRGGAQDVLVATLALLVVVGASIAMEQAASRLGTRLGVPEIVVGGLVLAAVTSLPNAVAAVYLAMRGRGAASLSTAMNSNAINVIAGLLLPGALVGIGPPGGPATLIAAYYLGMTVCVLTSAYLARGLQRRHGVLIICAYLTFAGTVLASAYGSGLGIALAILLPTAAGIAAAARAGSAPQRALDR